MISVELSFCVLTGPIAGAEEQATGSRDRGLPEPVWEAFGSAPALRAAAEGAEEDCWSDESPAGEAEYFIAHLLILFVVFFLYISDVHQGMKLYTPLI